MKYIRLLLVIPLLFLSGCNKDFEEGKLSESQTKILKYLPYDTQTLIYINFENLKEIPVVDSNVTKMLKDNNKYPFAKYIKETFVSFNWSEINTGLFILTEDADTYLKKLKTVKINNKQVHVYKESYLYSPEGNILISTTDSAYLVQVIDKNFKSLSTNEEFSYILNSIKDKENFWMASSDGTGIMSLINLVFGNRYNSARKILKMVDNYNISTSFNNIYTIHSVWECNDIGSALLIENGIKSGMATGIFSKGNPTLEKIFDKVQIDRHNNNVSFAVTLTKEELNYLKKNNQKK